MQFLYNTKITIILLKVLMAKKKVYGTCLFCCEHKELKRSHTINRTFFNELMKSCEATNSARVVSTNSPIIRNSNDNWTDHLLCEGCESYFNQHFDGYGANALRGKIVGQKISHTDDMVFYQNIDTTNIILYILSLFWRGAGSKHPSYELLITHPNIHKFLIESFQKRQFDSRYINIRISALYDSFGVADCNAIKQMITSPFRRVHESNKAFSYFFLFEGFLIEIYFGRLRHAIRKNGAWIAPSLKYIKCKKVDIHSIPELQKVFTQMFIAKDYMTKNNLALK